MKILLVTEKCNPKNDQRDGGSRLITTLQKALSDSLKIMQFGTFIGSKAEWNFSYPINTANRFERRIANAEFIAQKVKSVEDGFTHVIFVHIAMQFGLSRVSLRNDICIWTLPMFLSASYELSGEQVPTEYKELEHLTLLNSQNILTPSYLEKRQLVDLYQIAESRIHLVPRGIDTSFLAPKIRRLTKSPIFCNIGSIKPQKNTLALIDLFTKLLNKFPGAKLKVIGPAQDNTYYQKVIDKVLDLRLQNRIELIGYLAPDQIPQAIKDCHLHLSTAACETFGRAIFETLALGLPNIAKIANNGAADFLSNLPYIKFVSNNDEALEAACMLLDHLPELSEMAIEIGKLYDDEILARMLAAKIHNQNSAIISDFDGTLFHKTDPEETDKCIKEFKKFNTRIICSARSLEDLLEQDKLYNLQADWFIAYSGAVVADNSGKVLWKTPLTPKNLLKLQKIIPLSRIITFQNEVLQIALPENLLPNLHGLRIETYQGVSFISNWRASKLRAICRLLKHINWNGNIHAFGDGIYDQEFLTYFNGTLVTCGNIKSSNNIKRIAYV